jgi:hypothetical protein
VGGGGCGGKVLEGKYSKYCVHMYVNGKMRPSKSIPGMENDGRTEFSYDIVDVL